MKTIASLACLILVSCEGLTLTAVTPYGDVSTRNGETTISVKPVVIHEK